MRIRRKIDSRIEPHPFREKDFEITNPLVNEIIKHGQDIKTSVYQLPTVHNGKVNKLFQ
jgi:uncharacterized protein